MSSPAGVGLPSWMMLDRFVFRRDGDDGCFPDDDTAPMRANSFTSLGDPFTVALLPAAPPAVSRLYELWPPEHDSTGTDLITAHRGLLLLRTLSLTTEVATYPYRQDYFVFKAATVAGLHSRLKRLPDPECIEPLVLRKGRRQITLARWFHHHTIGLGGGGSEDEFAVVQLAKFVDIPCSSQKMGAESSVLHSSSPSSSESSDSDDDDDVISDGKKGAELCVFRSRLSTSDDVHGDDGVVAEGNWEILRLPIQYRHEDLSYLHGWSTDGAITLNDSICWFDYNRGGILSYTPPPLAAAAGEEEGEGVISYVRLPIDKPTNSFRSHLEMYRSLCVTGQRGNEQLKFVDVARSDDDFYGPLGYGSSFTITCHTFTPTDDQMWHKDVVITSQELWRLDEHKCLMPRNTVTTFPLVSRDEPHLVHFKMKEPRMRGKIDKVSVVVIDTITKTVVSVLPYIQGDEDLSGKDADMVEYNSRLPGPFLPTRF